MSPDGRLLDRLHGTVHSIGIFPLIIGRAPECGILVAEDDVSRQHACVMRTPTSYVIVDTSTLGTFVNGEPVAAQRVLRSGDVIEIGPRTFEFQLPDEPATPAAGTAWAAAALPPTRPHRRSRAMGKSGLLGQLPANRSRCVEWIRRYGVAEVVGTTTAVGGYWAAFALTGSVVASAFAAALCESVGFYGMLLLRDMVRDSYAAGARRARYGPREMAGTWRNLFIAFGPAELLDTAAIRPFCMGLGSQILGPQLGIIAGKLVADLVFYAPPILTSEPRRRLDERRGE